MVTQEDMSTLVKADILMLGLQMPFTGWVPLEAVFIQRL